MGSGLTGSFTSFCLAYSCFLSLLRWCGVSYLLLAILCVERLFHGTSPAGFSKTLGLGFGRQMISHGRRGNFRARGMDFIWWR